MQAKSFLTAQLFKSFPLSKEPTLHTTGIQPEPCWLTYLTESEVFSFFIIKTSTVVGIFRCMSVRWCICSIYVGTVTQQVTMCFGFKADGVFRGQSYQNEICAYPLTCGMGEWGLFHRGPSGKDLTEDMQHVAPVREHIREHTAETISSRMVKK